MLNLLVSMPLGFSFEALSLLMGGERVVFFEVTETRRRAAEGMGRHDRALASGIDAGGRRAVAHEPHPGVVCPRLGP
jgi:hypothetical protein